MSYFDKTLDYRFHKPTGDQPQAIEQLVKGFQEGNQFQTLLGVTGSGKTFTMANVIQALNKPTLVIIRKPLFHRFNMAVISLKFVQFPKKFV